MQRAKNITLPRRRTRLEQGYLDSGEDAAALASDLHFERFVLVYVCENVFQVLGGKVPIAKGLVDDLTCDVYLHGFTH